jgi:hypothetical protein
MRLALACCGLVTALVCAPAWGEVGTARVATLKADVAEWSVVPSAGLVPAGRVRIVVRNLGRESHEIVVVKTVSFDPQLQIRGDRAVVRPLQRPVVLRPGGTASFVISVRSGSYLLLDNLPQHYGKGTSVAFSVR